ncbi:hypothetical protein ISF_00362 [Cordyceps fumosorosea ARSEF 2679]|uniref:Uncharacterized protein n=1 Tax=Cordyceps fumosorosea (strain ARSEF 2679) TaxID=1081104 RepID=A0A168E7F3_CORFA|nr:hypothetical protein ISF_00362 [Cordyceps fumosorosea ARSEF 2679]OAA73461.1 hypothetical protein ISF_00362 [Cordyceps fumosorosea ARSEF 2679]
MPIRNPFARRPELVIPDNENERPAQENDSPGFERVDTVGSKASSMSIRSRRSHDNGEYKMSVVNGSGIYLPPSPVEEKGQHWPKRNLSSRASTDTGSSFGDIEPFSISRESFDSYRRSFDITARSPIKHNAPVRQSLDSARFPRHQLSVHRKMERQAPTPEESFEDVGLDDGKQQPRKRGFFAKLTESQDKDSMPRFLMGGRKRGHSGQGAELGSVEHAATPATGERH